MKKLSIPTGTGVKAVPLKDRAGHVLCTVYYDPNDTAAIGRYQSAVEAMRKVFKRLNTVSIQADGSPATVQYAPSLNAAEREIKQIIGQFLPMDNPEGLFEAQRPFASVKGTFYCAHVLNALSAVLKKTAGEVEA